MKRGRNEPCHCGSGLKYKKCCYDSDRAPVLESARDSQGLLIGKPPIDTEWPAQGKRVRAVGDTIAIRPPHETDHEFFVELLCSGTLGPDWGREQMCLPEADRHVIARWIDAYERTRGNEVTGTPITKMGDHLYTAEATGETKSLLCLAYDNYSLRHAMALPDTLVKRLKNPRQFQGARYEMAIAAVFVRAGYNIDWLNSRERKLPEFIARHPSSRVEIAVEAKSRHRPGVLGRAGDRPAIDRVRADVDGLMKRALEKEVDGRPFVVCLDLNLPTQLGDNIETWGEELRRDVLAPFGSEATGQPDRFSAVFFTNYSWHWDGKEPAGNPVSFTIRGLSSAVLLQANEAGLLAEAVMQYGDVPAGVS